MSLILGINAYHGDSSACLLRDGQFVAAVEEERFRRVKHWAGFPRDAVRWCLKAGGVRLDDLDGVAMNRDPRANLHRKALYTLAKWPDPRLLLSRLRNARDWATVEGELRRSCPGQRLHGGLRHIEHHSAHLASSFYASPFEEAVIVSVDGFGDFASARWGVGTNSGITIDGGVYFPHSLGVFYETITQYLGFPNYGDEYKMMGLAAYGEPRFLAQMRELVRSKRSGGFELGLRFFRHHRENISYTWKDCAPSVGRLFTDELENLLGPRRSKGEPLTQRHRDIARSAQAVYEEVLFDLLTVLQGRHAIHNLALAGGCAMNSSANGRIREKTPFKRLYVPPAPGDAGGAMGAALLLWHELNGQKRAARMDSAYWGPEFSEQQISESLARRRAKLSDLRCEVTSLRDSGDLCRRVARLIAAEQVVGWFQGRMEWGPRALGNRSILCDPRNAGVRELLNRRIKRREPFRPFAPSVLREAVGDWFEVDDESPFMMKVLRIRKQRRALIPAVTHADGTGRLQTVTRQANPLYYRLIETFGELTGVPMLLNTSFNENEPIVCTPDEALDCFLRTGMDVLVLGNRIVQRAVGGGE